jgi:uncharacterized protein (TIGR03663 family)
MQTSQTGRKFSSLSGPRGAALLLLAIIIALTLRCPDLSVRPMHNDEAVNAIKFRALMEQGSYRYDPNEYHGPSLYYFTLAWTKITGATDFVKLTEARLRALTVLFGVGLFFLLPLVADGLGRRATICSAMLIAISPAMVFYSRYYIHEMLLVFFTFLALAAFWRHYRSGKIIGAVIAGVAAGLMQSTKETFVLSLVAILVALLLNKLWTRSGDSTTAHPRRIFKPIAAGLVAWLAVVVIFFSSFFSNAAGLLDAFKTFLPMFHRAAGDSAHVHPWNFYLARLSFFHISGGPVWSEGFILGLAIIGIFVAFTRKGAADSRPNFLRFVVFYTLTLAVIYSSIAYKTPWCLLSFWHGAIFLAGAGAVAAWQFAARRWMKLVVAILLFAGGGQLAFQAWQASVTFCEDQRNPYVYAQTSENILEMVSEVEALARVSSQGRHVRVDVIAPESDYWSLPWYLRSFDQVGWWSEMPKESLVPLIIVSTKSAAKFERDQSYQAAGIFELRPGVFFALYVQPDLWRAYLDAKMKTEK